MTLALNEKRLARGGHLGQLVLGAPSGPLYTTRCRATEVVRVYLEMGSGCCNCFVKASPIVAVRYGSSPGVYLEKRRHAVSLEKSSISAGEELAGPQCSYPNAALWPG